MGKASRKLKASLKEITFGKGRHSKALEPPHEPTAKNDSVDEPNAIFRIHLTHISILIVLFLLLRFLFLLNFPIFNDEAIYIDYAQASHASWDEFKFISMDNPFGDWKPPLIYWICSFVIKLFDNPLLAARLVAVVASLIGLLSVYAFAGYYFNSRKTALWAGLFWTLNPMVLFYDREFVAETFVYSFTAATFLFVYLTISKNKWNLLPAIFFGTLALLSKQTGQLFVIGLIFFAILQIKIKASQQSGHRVEIRYTNLFFILMAITLPYAIYHIIIPTQYFRAYGHFSSMFAFSFKELAQFPIEIWLENFKRIFNLFKHYYSSLSLLLILFFVYQCITRRKIHDLLLLIWFIFITSMIIFAFKAFSEYNINTAVVAIMTLVMGASAEYLENHSKKFAGKIFRYLVQYGVAGLLISVWVYSLSFYYISPRDYIMKFGSPWMRDNYYLGWPSGFGVSEVVALLAKERNKYVYLDPQWGNPTCGIRVYQESLRSLKFVWLDDTIINQLDSMPPNTAICIFKYRHDLPAYNEIISLKICENRTVFQWEKDQIPLVVCRN